MANGEAANLEVASTQGEDEEFGDFTNSEELDPLYDKALSLIKRERRVSTSFLSEITTPAACVDACLCVPSTFKLISTTFEILSSLFIFSCKAISDLIDSLKVSGFDGLKGINLAKESTSPYGTSKTLPISLTAALDAKVPNVITVSYTHLTLPTNREV